MLSVLEQVGAGNGQKLKIVVSAPLGVILKTVPAPKTPPPTVVP
jgi:hypothetical protein